MINILTTISYPEIEHGVNFMGMMMWVAVFGVLGFMLVLMVLNIIKYIKAEKSKKGVKRPKLIISEKPLRPREGRHKT